MGADMTLAVARAPWFASNVSITQDKRWPAILHQAEERINAYPIDHFDEDFLEDFVDTQYSGDLDLTDPTPETLLGIFRSIMISKLRSFATVHVAADTTYLTLPRDVTTLTVNGEEYWVTGGLTWGDPPTDSFWFIEALEEIQLFDRPLE